MPNKLGRLIAGKPIYYISGAVYAHFELWHVEKHGDEKTKQQGGENSDFEFIGKVKAGFD